MPRLLGRVGIEALARRRCPADARGTCPRGQVGGQLRHRSAARDQRLLVRIAVHVTEQQAALRARAHQHLARQRRRDRRAAHEIARTHFDLAGRGTPVLVGQLDIGEALRAAAVVLEIPLALVPIVRLPADVGASWRRASPRANSTGFGTTKRSWRLSICCEDGGGFAFGAAAVGRGQCLFHVLQRRRIEAGARGCGPWIDFPVAGGDARVDVLLQPVWPAPVRIRIEIDQLHDRARIVERHGVS